MYSLIFVLTFITSWIKLSCTSVKCLSGKTVRCFENRMLGLHDQKRRRKEKQYRREKQITSAGSPAQQRHKHWLSSWPSLWLSSLTSCHQSQPTSLEEERRNGAAAVRVTRISCLLPDWHTQAEKYRVTTTVAEEGDRAQNSPSEAALWPAEGEIWLRKQSFFSKIFRWKRQRGHLYPTYWMFFKDKTDCDMH